MKIATEFIILHEDGEMPKEEQFCPSLWLGDDYDSDGDYYYDHIDGRWTSLLIKKKEENEKNTVLEVSVYREKNRDYDPSVLEVDDLKRFITYRNNGRYSMNSEICSISNLCITSIRFETHSIMHYQEFLSTVFFFLNYTRGILINFDELNADGFKRKFIE
ncbi:hypothetical protein [Zooshikella harenae]|uniref:Uncharacterized protein n=1 Tax=Zooshikella harenae TaxID=2827238 RepID=A0ABS5ZJA9_9GAMM|nr:hypothetical protein [Zooshikella harenae]MBU2713082.1 hypothetical protein [Zooshikella harenae]